MYKIAIPKREQNGEETIDADQQSDTFAVNETDDEGTHGECADGHGDKVVAEDGHEEGGKGAKALEGNGQGPDGDQMVAGAGEHSGRHENRVGSEFGSELDRLLSMPMADVGQVEVGGCTQRRK